MRNNLSVVLFISILFIGCEGKQEPIPSYIKINEADFVFNNPESTGIGGTNITDVWLYIDNQLAGLYQLPAVVAVAGEGNHEIRMASGIRISGVQSLQLAYPFHRQFNAGTLNLIGLDTLTITPEYEYGGGSVFAWKEDFESSLGSSMDTIFGSLADLEQVPVPDSPFYIQTLSGHARLTEELSYFKAATDDLYPIPITALPFYLELDYSCNQQFVVSILIKRFGDVTREQSVIFLNPTTNSSTPVWNKIYIEMTPFISGQVDAEGFGFSITANYDPSVEEGLIYFDNFKLIHN
ncbi:MAG TPA: hypothetical protein DDX92_05570 [Flavobacteriales bacterium]|jgi:hypothetical protein|nr:hypothetical protein [Flavobacteriales bacterium]